MFVEENASETTEMLMDVLDPKSAMLWESNSMLINPSVIKKVLMTPLIYREVCT